MFEEQERQRRLYGVTPSAYPYGLNGSSPAYSAMDLFRQERDRLQSRSGFERHDIPGQLFGVRSGSYRQFVDGPLSDALELRSSYLNADMQDAIQGAISAQRELERQFRRPEFDELPKLAFEAMESSLIACEYLETIGELEAAMRQLNVPWVRLDGSPNSATAFADLMGIGKALRTTSPYQPSFVNALRTSLGDWRDDFIPSIEQLSDPVLRMELYLERGFDPSIIALPARAFVLSTRVSGLEAPLYEDLEDDDEESDRAEATFALLRKFERVVRRFVMKLMEEAFGEDWVQHRLPSGMLDRWTQKKEKAIKAGRAEKPIIFYADFTEYKIIMEMTKNWSEVFESHFGDEHAFKESFQRLYAVRNATMHADDITNADELLAIVETSRIIKALQNVI